MMIPLPQTVRQALGDPASADLASWFEAILDERTIPRSDLHDLSLRVDARFDRVEARLDAMDARFAEIDIRFVRVEARLDHIDGDLAKLEQQLLAFRSDVDLRFDAVHQQFDRLNERIISQTRWTVGVLGLFGTLIAGIVALGQLY